MVKIAKTWLILPFQPPKGAFISFLLQVLQHASSFPICFRKHKRDKQKWRLASEALRDPAGDLRSHSAVPSQRAAADVQWLEHTKPATSSYHGPQWQHITLTSRACGTCVPSHGQEHPTLWQKLPFQVGKMGLGKYRNQVWGLREEL